MKALGAWGTMTGMASVAGVFLGGVISSGPGWRWVLFVNLPVCAMVLAAAFRLLPAEATGPFGKTGVDLSRFDVPGAILGTGGMLLLIFALVRAPDDGWGRRGPSASSPPRRRC